MNIAASGHPLRFLPISLRIQGLPILIIGGGHVALHKAQLLLPFDPILSLVAPAFLPDFNDLPFTLTTRPFLPSDLDHTFLVYIATDDHALNASIKALCTQRRILASVSDAPELCDFTSPAIFLDPPFSVAVASDATDVRHAISLRDTIRRLLPRLRRTPLSS